MKCVVLLPNGKIALGKLAQALMYGATTIAVEHLPSRRIAPTPPPSAAS
jgi:hypothetical protein